MPTVQACVRAPRTFRRPRLDVWSINQAEITELTGQSRADYERELRISALGFLVCANCTTPLWRRVCCFEMKREVRPRSGDQRLALELALFESIRSPA